MLGALLVTAAAHAPGQHGRVLHITDLHYDQYYSPGSYGSCVPEVFNDGLCCRDENVGVEPYRKAGKFGDHNCDTPMTLLRLVFKHLNATYSAFPERRPDFILWTGDNDHHHKHNRTKRSAQYALEEMTNLFTTYLPDFRVYPALGNLDTVPDGALDLPPTNYWLTGQATKFWSPWIRDQAAKSTLYYGGYYTQMARQDGKVKANVRIVALNTLLNYTTGEDPAEQWSWLRDVVVNATKRGEKIWIIQHFPLSTWPKARLNKYMDLLAEFPNTVVAHFSGHTHRDQFTLLRRYNTTDYTLEPLVYGVNFISPSIVPENTNPSYREIIYDVGGGNVLDVETFTISNFDLLNKGNATTAEFPKRYSFSQAYGLTNMSDLTQWVNLTERLHSSVALFQQYESFWKAGFEYKNGSCGKSCQWQTVCDIALVLEADRKYCYAHTPSPTPGPTPPPSPTLAPTAPLPVPTAAPSN